ncbi:hypothetical protein [Variovorax gossypii]
MHRPTLIALVLAVVAMHAAVLWLLLGATQPHRRAAEAARRVVMEVVQVAQPVLKAEPPAPQKEAAPRAPARAARAIARRAPQPARGNAITAPAAPAMADEAARAASPVPARPLILHSESTRRALRDIGRERSFADRAGQELNGNPRSAFDSRLSAEVAGSARRDCMKGQFKGNSMGLLSLPALALAAAQGDCGR